MLNYPRMPWNANHSEEQPCRMIVYDTETTWTDHQSRVMMQNHTWRLAVASAWIRRGTRWTHKGYCWASKPQQLWDFILAFCRPRERLWVYAHNATFDFTVAGGWNLLDQGTLRLTEVGRWYTDRKTGMVRQAKDWKGKLAVDSLPFIVETATDKGRINFVDTMNYLPVSLETVAAWVGMAKVPLPQREASEQEWYARCQRDVEITEAFVHKLMELWRHERLGNWQPTIGSLAYSSFRHLVRDSGIVAHGCQPASPEDAFRYWSDKRRMPPDAADTARLERDAYYGARVLPGFLGDIMPAECLPGNGELFGESAKRSRIDGPVKVYDVNGLYASVMAGRQYPIELLDTLWETDVAELKRLCLAMPTIARVRISSATHEYPVRVDGRTVYARGDFVTSLCGPELSLALDRGHVEQCHQAAVYYGGFPFTKYVMYWWNKRLAAIGAGDVAMSKLCKNIINALFGKLGQRRPLWQRDDSVIAPVRWGPFLCNPGDGRGLLRCRSVAGVAQSVQDRVDCRHTMTATAAFVTAHARVFMDRVRQALPPKSVLYQDTDSLFLLPSGAEALECSGLVHDTDLGRFKFQGCYQLVTLRGPKNYEVDGRNVAAGLRATAKPDGEGRWRQWLFERCKSIIGREPDGSIWAWQDVFTSPMAVSGVVATASGWTEPITLHR